VSCQLALYSIKLSRRHAAARTCYVFLELLPSDRNTGRNGNLSCLSTLRPINVEVHHNLICWHATDQENYDVTIAAHWPSILQPRHLSTSLIGHIVCVGKGEYRSTTQRKPFVPFTAVVNPFLPRTHHRLRLKWMPEQHCGLCCRRAEGNCLRLSGHRMESTHPRWRWMGSEFGSSTLKRDCGAIWLEVGVLCDGCGMSISIYVLKYGCCFCTLCGALLC
jgi:hypothetical protein